MMREYQVRICERLGVKFLGPTRHSRPSRLARNATYDRSCLKADMRRAPTRLLLEIEIAERLPGGVLHDEAGIVMLLDAKAVGNGAGLC
jgi:hypothetical protein